MIMRKTLFISFVLAFALLGACQRTETSAINPAADETTKMAGKHEMSPEDLGELGARIEREPDKAKELLSEHGLDEKSFEAEIRKITEDPEASKRYAAAYEKAKA